MGNTNYRQWMVSGEESSTKNSRIKVITIQCDILFRNKFKMAYDTICSFRKLIKFLFEFFRIIRMTILLNGKLKMLRRNF